MYSPLESLIGHYRGKKDIGNSLAAAAITGALFKSTGEIVPHYLFSVYDVSLHLISMYIWMKVASNMPECSLYTVTVVSRVSAHGCLNITHDFGLHGHLPRIKIPYVCIEAAIVVP